MNHWILTFSFFLILFLFLFLEFSNWYSKNSISSFQLVSLMNRKSVLLIDCREKEFYLRGHIIGSNNFSLSDNDVFFKKYLKKTIILICENGKISSKYVLFLKKKGYLDVQFLEGGIVAWINFGFPLV